ncbi:MAG TPA: response regulator transcription factor [Nitrospira sp.]|nr:response regulator transcription factor [Nitrospira sp.]
MATARIIRVVLVEDHSGIREGLHSFLESYPDVAVVGEAASGHEAMALVERLLPTVVVMDINIPAMDGITATRLLRARYPNIPVIGLTIHVEQHYLRLMQEAGAFRVLTKGEDAVDGLYQAIRAAAASLDIPVGPQEPAAPSRYNPAKTSREQSAYGPTLRSEGS